MFRNLPAWDPRVVAERVARERPAQALRESRRGLAYRKHYSGEFVCLGAAKLFRREESSKRLSKCVLKGRERTRSIKSTKGDWEKVKPVDSKLCERWGKALRACVSPPWFAKLSKPLVKRERERERKRERESLFSRRRAALLSSGTRKGLVSVEGLFPTRYPGPPKRPRGRRARVSLSLSLAFVNPAGASIRESFAYAARLCKPRARPARAHSRRTRPTHSRGALRSYATQTHTQDQPLSNNNNKITKSKNRTTSIRISNLESRISHLSSLFKGVKNEECKERGVLLMAKESNPCTV